MRIKYKLISLILTLLISAIGSITYLLNKYFEDAIINETYKTCNNLSILITNASREELFIGMSNFESLENILNTVKSSNIFGLKKIQVVNTKGKIVVSLDKNEIEQDLSSDDISYISRIESLSLLELENGEDTILKYTSPIYLSVEKENFKLGAAIFEFSKNELFLPLENLKEKIYGVSILILIISILVSLTTSYLITKPLEKLKLGIDKYAEGDLDYKIEINSKDEFGTLAENFNFMSEKLREIDRIKDEFLANTSHELKTPLNGIIGIAESLKYSPDSVLNKYTLENLDFIISSGKRLNNLVNDILDYSIIKKDQISLKKNNLNLKVIFDLVIVILKRGIKNISIDIINNIPESLPLIYADENRVQQIIYNLLGNALKFTNSGEIEITARDDLNYGWNKNGQKIPPKVIVSIRDTGIGIPKEKLNSIFNQFEQVDTGIQKNFGGTGLGLAITKKLLELHECSIWVESNLGEGSTFYFTLPISENQLVQPVNQKEAEIIDSLISDEKKESNLPLLYKRDNPNILIIDDEPINVQVVRNHLVDKNYNIFSAYNGKDGLNIIKENKIDLVLLDLMMPEFNGFQITELIRSAFDLSKLPIIIITARNQLSDFISAFSHGVNDYISKPISREELIARVRTHLELKKMNDNLEFLVNKRTEELSKIKKEIESINIFTRIINEHSNMKEVFINISQYLFNNYDIEATILFLLSENKSSFDCFRFYSYFKVSQELIDYIESTQVSVHSNSLLNFVSARKKPFLFKSTEITSCEIDKEFVSRLGIKSGLILPLVIQSETVGLYLLTNISKNFELKRRRIYSINNFLRQTAGTINGIRLLIESNRAKSSLLEEKTKLEVTMSELERTQEELLKSEKLAAMGQLISNVSHELNTPIGAIKATSNNIKNSVVHLLDFLKNNLEKENDSLSILKVNFIDTTIKNLNKATSTKIDRENKKKIKIILQEEKIPEISEITDILSILKFSGVDDNTLALLKHETSYEFLSLVLNLAGLYDKSSILETSVEKTSKIIFALKNFSDDSVFSSKTTYQFSERLNQISLIYESNYNKGIEISKKFHDNPEFPCHAYELDQVWKNLIINSLHAMGNSGILEISLSITNHIFKNSNEPKETAYIRIADSGHGIPETLQPKVFQPFFTTKSAGDGSGMGLYLCKKIVEKHNGEISFKSKPGETIFEIYIPFSPKIYFSLS